MKPTYLLLALSLFLAACSTHPVSLDYNPRLAAGFRTGGQHNVEAGVFKDDRDVGDTTLGQIREVGGPLEKRIDTNVPVSQIVSNTFAHGLEARQMLAGRRAKFVLGGIIRELSCDQVLRMGSSVDIVVTLTEPGQHGPVFRKSYQAENTETTTKLGVFGEPEELRKLTARTLQQAVDKALDDPELRAITDAP